MSGRQSKFLQWINYRIRVTINENRILIGTFLAFDKHMNLVLADTEEYSTIKIKKKNLKNNENKLKERKRTMGLVLLRGDSIVSISADSPPSQNQKRFDDIQNPGIGIAQAVGKLISNPNQIQAPSGLGTIGRGVGVPNMMGMVPPQMQNMPPLGRGVMPPQMPPPPGMRMNVVPPNMPPPNMGINMNNMNVNMNINNNNNNTDKV